MTLVQQAVPQYQTSGSFKSFHGIQYLTFITEAFSSILEHSHYCITGKYNNILLANVAYLPHMNMQRFCQHDFQVVAV
ncbi:hypothetical protein BDQ12DRAFT_224170 [Crucibulum laeve]|uniref:Uncharacterized protein n=1 Tax=Crucibulum laeve TaxID=68775 RepID=A0A5C3LUL6_9AGAR|nr:hypothetical protein BDQ12DRAFT_224170 [Crucibulum laeve]